MNIMSIEGLDPSLRVYSHADTLIAVKLTRADDPRRNKASDMVFDMTCFPVDETGQAIGPEMPPHRLTMCLDEADTPVFNPRGDTDTDEPVKGALMVAGGTLWEGNGLDWVERGPAPEGLEKASIAEKLAEWDRTARPLVEKAARAWQRRRDEQDIFEMIGANDDT